MREVAGTSAAPALLLARPSRRVVSEGGHGAARPLFRASTPSECVQPSQRTESAEGPEHTQKEKQHLPQCRAVMMGLFHQP